MPTGWTVWASNPGGGEIFQTSLNQPPVKWVPGLSRGLLSGRDADPSPPSSAGVKNRVELYLYSP